MHTIHIMPLDGLWYVRVQGGQGIMDFPTRDEAFQRCRELIGPGGGSILIHGADGSLQEEHLVGPSPDIR